MVSVQRSVQAPVPDAATWMRTDCTATLSVAVAAMVTAPDTVPPGSVTDTVGGVQSAAAVTVALRVVALVSVAPEKPARCGSVQASAASARPVRTRSAGFMAVSGR